MISLDEILQKAQKAQSLYATFSQEKVDKIFYHAAIAATKARIILAKEAVEETQMGVLEDKVVKNHFSSEFIFNKYKGRQTCGVFEYDEAGGISKSYEPLGVIAGIVPTTNPTSTVIFKALLALKTRNGIVFSPHPRSKNCSIHAMKIILEAAVKAGAPENIISWIEEPDIELTQQLMGHPNISLILATGGPGLVRSAYSSGTPAIGVGPGNVPAVIEKSADLKMAVSSILTSKTFDNGTICASEQAIVCEKDVYEEVKDLLKNQNCYFLEGNEKNTVRNTLFHEGKLNSKIVGKSAYEIALLAEISIDPKTKMLVAEVEDVGNDELFSMEKLSPVIALYKEDDFENCMNKAYELVRFGGMGHTAILHINPKEKDKINNFSVKMPVARVLINMPGAQGAIGDIYNYQLNPSLTLGCGSWGKNSIAENISVTHLLNTKTTAERREAGFCFQAPQKIYYHLGCLTDGLKDIDDAKNVFIVTSKTVSDKYIEKVQNHISSPVTVYDKFSSLPDEEEGEKAFNLLKTVRPDVIIALGNNALINMAKVLWLYYEHPKSSIDELTMRFMDINKRVHGFQKLGQKARFVAIPTLGGGSEVTPYASIYGERKEKQYFLFDYELMPDIAIVDPDFISEIKPEEIAVSGLNSLVYALEAYVSVLSSPYIDGLALEAIELLFENLQSGYEKRDKKAIEKIFYAGTIAGMSFSNAFAGLCRALAHPIEKEFSLTPGYAVSLFIEEVIRYNSSETPEKMTVFSGYYYPAVNEKYAKIVNHLRLDEEDSIEALIKKIRDMKKQLNMPSSLIDLNIDPEVYKEKIDQMALEAIDDQSVWTNPRFVLLEEIKEIYKSLL